MKKTILRGGLLCASAMYCSAASPATVVMTIPAGDLVNSFNPSPAESSGAFQRDQSFHCFSSFENGKPTYVRGTAQGYWYFEGPVVDGGTSVLSLYANSLSYGSFPIVGSLTIKYSSDYLSASGVAASCQPSSLCSMWPTTLTSGVSSSKSTTSVCFWDSSLTHGTNANLLSEWTSSQGTTWMCKSPTAANPNAITGSWKYVNDQSECESRGYSFPCKDNIGPYTNGITSTLPDGKGFLVTQWFGINFNPDQNNGEANGRSIFAAVSSTSVAGSYCVYDQSTMKIKYCYPEAYSVSGLSTAAKCATYASVGVPAPAPSDTPHGLAKGAIGGIIIGCFFFFGFVWAGYHYFTKNYMLKEPERPMASNKELMHGGGFELKN